MAVLSDLEIVVGALVLVATLYDVFQSIVLPRPSVARIRFGPTLIRYGWRIWRTVVTRVRSLRRREAAFAVYAPFMVAVLLVLWAFASIAAYALLYDGLDGGLTPHPGSFGAALYFSAGRFLAFQNGNTAVNGTVVPLLTSLEAANGFGLFALVISLLFSLFNAFQRRETAVVALDALAGAPPSGVQLLEMCAKHHMPEQLVTTFVTWRDWAADVLESHLAYPLLFYFRSSHDNESWTNSFGAVMDAATLVLSVVEDGPVGPARLMYKVGDHLVQDMRQYLGIPQSDEIFIERHEFLEACERLERAGYTLRDPDHGWEEFRRLRSSYGSLLNQVARNLVVPPAPWIGDRSYLPHRDRAQRSRRRAA
jgi:hypothetical protein